MKDYYVISRSKKLFAIYGIVFSKFLYIYCKKEIYYVTIFQLFFMTTAALRYIYINALKMGTLGAMCGPCMTLQHCRQINMANHLMLCFSLCSEIWRKQNNNNYKCNKVRYSKEVKIYDKVCSYSSYSI